MCPHECLLSSGDELEGRMRPHGDFWDKDSVPREHWDDILPSLTIHTTEQSENATKSPISCFIELYPDDNGLS